MKLTMGSRSILYGAHQFAIHPWFVAWGWWKLYGFPWDPRLWICFFVHDLGYFGKPNMDGPEGEEHVWWGANFVGLWLGREWYWLCLYHSRYQAKADGFSPSRLCFADKLAFVITPKWLYKLLVTGTGEWKEYAQAHRHEVHADRWDFDGWHDASRAYVKAWIEKHVDGTKDNWTKEKPRGESQATACSQ